MGKVITVTNQKGGVGKTSLLAAVAAYLASLGFKVLVIDLDPQGNTTAMFDRKIYEEDPTSLATSDTVHATFQNNEPLVCFDTQVENVSLCPSHPALRDIVYKEVERQYLTQRIKEELDREEIEMDSDTNPIRTKVRDKYDYILIDTPSFLGGFLTPSAYLASDSVLIVTTPSDRSIEGVDEVYNEIQKLINSNDAKLKILGIVINKAVLARRKTDDLPKHIATRIALNALTGHDIYKNIICATIIPDSASETSADVIKTNSYTHNPHSSFSKAIVNLSKELLKV